MKVPTPCGQGGTPQEGGTPWGDRGYPAGSGSGGSDLRQGTAGFKNDHFSLPLLRSAAGGGGWRHPQHPPATVHPLPTQPRPPDPPGQVAGPRPSGTVPRSPRPARRASPLPSRLIVRARLCSNYLPVSGRHAAGSASPSPTLGQPPCRGVTGEQGGHRGGQHPDTPRTLRAPRDRSSISFSPPPTPPRRSSFSALWFN